MPQTDLSWACSQSKMGSSSVAVAVVKAVCNRSALVMTLQMKWLFVWSAPASSRYIIALHDFEMDSSGVCPGTGTVIQRATDALSLRLSSVLRSPARG